MNDIFNQFAYSFALRSPAHTKTNSFKISRNKYSIIDSFWTKRINEAERDAYISSYDAFDAGEMKYLDKCKTEADEYKADVVTDYETGCRRWQISHHSVFMPYDDEILATKILLKDLESTLNDQINYNIKSGKAATIDINWYNKAIDFCKDHIKELEDQGIVSTFGCKKEAC